MSCEQIVVETPLQELLLDQQPELLVDELDIGGTVVDPANNELLIDDTAEMLVVEGDEQVTLLETGTQGPAGAPGQPGEATLSLVAGGPIGGHRVVRSLAGVAVYADQNTVPDAVCVLGISKGAASAGAEVQVQLMGTMDEPSWSWTPDQPLFVGPAGTLTQTPPATGYRLIVGVALTATKINIGLKMPIILE